MFATFNVVHYPSGARSLIMYDHASDRYDWWSVEPYDTLLLNGIRFASMTFGAIRASTNLH